MIPVNISRIWGCEIEGKAANRGKLPPWKTRASSHRKTGSQCGIYISQWSHPRDKRTGCLYTNCHPSLQGLLPGGVNSLLLPFCCVRKPSGKERQMLAEEVRQWAQNRQSPALGQMGKALMASPTLYHLSAQDFKVGSCMCQPLWKLARENLESEGSSFCKLGKRK